MCVGFGGMYEQVHSLGLEKVSPSITCRAGLGLPCKAGCPGKDHLSTQSSLQSIYCLVLGLRLSRSCSAPQPSTPAVHQSIHSLPGVLPLGHACFALVEWERTAALRPSSVVPLPG